MSLTRVVVSFSIALSMFLMSSTLAAAASPCDGATHPAQCGWFDGASLPPFVRDAIVVKGGTIGSGNVLVLTSGDPADADNEISTDLAQAGCGTNPDGWETYDCVLLDQYVPPEDAVVIALSSEWFEWYQTIFTDWMTTAGAGLPTVDVSINSWIDNKVDVLPYGPMDTGVVILTSLAQSKMVNFRVADSGDHIYDTAVAVVPATWFSGVSGSDGDTTILCGNGVLEPGEECDDGNTVTDDGCSSLCLGTQPPGGDVPSATCGNLVYAWPDGMTKPYTCGNDLCGGFRCVVGNTISPACFTADQCAAACAGACVDVQVAQLDCSEMCTVQPPATEPPPPLPQTCASLAYVFPDGNTLPYTCDDDCAGERCVIGTTVDPTCYDAGACDETTCPDGTCVDTPTEDCNELCALGELPAACTPEEVDQLRPAPNQSGRCLGNFEICKSSGFWEIADGSWEPQDEECNGLDDNCNGVADDMFYTCGDPGLCQNTVNTCNPADPAVPVECVPLPAPSEVEICNDGLDNDCDGEADDGCECGDDECMPGETYAGCPNDCSAPADGIACDDGDLCTTGEAYDAGACVGGVAVTCGDENACVIAGACDPATGCSATKVDCDDGDPCTIDGCDEIEGCTHAADPQCEPTDGDGDGYPAAPGGTDCDDGDPAVNPGAAESCNGTDDDCDQAVDDGFDVGSPCESAPNDCGATLSGAHVCSADGLGVECDAETPENPPGYGDACTSEPNACDATASGAIQCNGSCDAETPANPPGYGEACASDPNACGAIAEGTVGCNGCDAETPANPPGYGDACTSDPNACGDTNAGEVGCEGCDAEPPQAADADGDGTPDCVDDCPADPLKTEPGTCGCGVPEASATFYRDADGDGFGNAADSTQGCTPPAGYVTDATDCDDAEASVHPGAAEQCNGRDDDCDAAADDNVDGDADGVEDCRADRCLDTKADDEYLPPLPVRGLGENRWVVERSGQTLVWVTTADKKAARFRPTIAYTHGCSCKQILDEHPPLDDELGALGQYLFGCAKGTLTSFHKR